MCWTSPNGISASAADRGQDRDHRRDPEQVADARGRTRGLLRRELDDLGDRLDQPERADAVRAVASLEASEQLALVDGQHRQDRERDHEDHERLDDLDPPRLEVEGVAERDHGLMHLDQRLGEGVGGVGGDALGEERGARGDAGADRGASPRRRVPF